MSQQEGRQALLKMKPKLKKKNIASPFFFSFFYKNTHYAGIKEWHTTVFLVSECAWAALSIEKHFLGALKSIYTLAITAQD